MRRTQVYGMLLTIFLVSACKKVIDVDLKSATPQVVIEGNITDAAGVYVVKITKTVDFAADNVYPPVTNAVVTITDSTMNRTEQLQQADSGIYFSTTILGVSQHTYGLTVDV